MPRFGYAVFTKTASEDFQGGAVHDDAQPEASSGQDHQSGFLLRACCSSQFISLDPALNRLILGFRSLDEDGHGYPGQNTWHVDGPNVASPAQLSAEREREIDVRAKETKVIAALYDREMVRRRLTVSALMYRLSPDRI